MAPTPACHISWLNTGIASSSKSTALFFNTSHKPAYLVTTSKGGKYMTAASYIFKIIKKKLPSLYFKQCFSDFKTILIFQ